MELTRWKQPAFTAAARSSAPCVPTMFAFFIVSALASMSYTAPRWKKCLTLPLSFLTSTGDTPSFGEPRSPLIGTTRFTLSLPQNSRSSSSLPTDLGRTST